MVEKILKIHVEDEFCDGEDDNGNALALARILLSCDDVSEVKRLSELVKKEHLYAVKRFDYTPEYFSDYEGFDWDGYKGEETVEWKGRVDVVCLHVTDDSFRWEGYLKHTNIRWSTESVEIKELP